MTIYEETLSALEYVSQLVKVEGIVMGVDAYFKFKQSYPYPQPDVLTLKGFAVTWDDDLEADTIAFISPDNIQGDDYGNTEYFA